MTTRSKTPGTIALLLAVVGLAGCSPAPEPWLQGESPRHLEVQHLRMKFVAAFAPGTAELSRGEAARLDAFLDQSGIRRNDHLYVEASTEDRMAAARIGRIARELDRHGLGAQTIPAEAEGPGANQLALLVDRYVVNLPDCPNWALPPNDDHDNQPPANFGCSTTTNLGLMIDDPHDLVVGRTPGPAEGDPALNAMARYRADKVKPLASSAGSSSGGSSGASSSASQ
jgi:pilus assembly protein CpaD